MTYTSNYCGIVDLMILPQLELLLLNRQRGQLGGLLRQGISWKNYTG